MIVQQFRVWAQTASASGRADGASALARAYLYSDLGDDQRAEALDMLTAFLDDPSPIVRRALAEAFASAVDAPPHILLALADDQPSIAAIVLARSPILRDPELIDCVATADSIAQAAIASRPVVSEIVAMTLAEIAAPEALIALAKNAAVELSPHAMMRMVARHGDNAKLRDVMLRRPDLSQAVRVELVSATARALSVFVTQRNWVSDERMKRVAIEAKDKAAIAIAGPDLDSASDLVAHLRQAGQLSIGFALRTLLSGRVELFKAVLAELADLPIVRVDGLVAQYDSAGFAALYRKAGLPPELMPAFRIALRAMQETDWTLARGAGLSRRMIERVLTGCTAINSGDLDQLLVLLRRFEAEAARDDARSTLRNTTPLKLSERAAPLVLTDIDAPEYQLPPTHGRERTGRLPIRADIDMVAMAAELCAA